jgi:hypothetical protein
MDQNEALTADQNEALTADQFRDVRGAVWACRSYVDPKTAKRVKVTPTQRLIALRLVEHWPRIFPSVRTLCWWTGYSDRAVQKALRALELAGIIRTTRRFGKSSTYEFPGVSIPRLGHGAGLAPRPDIAGGEPESPGGGEGGEPGTGVGGEPGSPPRGTHVPPNQQGLSNNKAEGRPGASGAAAPADRFSSQAPDPDPSSRVDRLWRNLKGWEPSSQLRTHARALGLTDDAFDRRLGALRNRPIRGGVYDRDAYVSEQFPRWVKWEAEEKMPVSSAGTGSRNSFQGSTLPLEANDRHKRFGAAYGIDVSAVVAQLVRENAVQNLGLGRARELIGERLMKMAAEARKQREREQREIDHAAE